MKSVIRSNRHVLGKRFKSVAVEALESIPSTMKASFSFNDPLHLHSTQLTQDERMIYDTAKAFCQDNLMPRVLEANRNETFDRNIMTEFGSLGLLGKYLIFDYDYYNKNL